jgi:hypothetical protein
MNALIGPIKAFIYFFLCLFMSVVPYINFLLKSGSYSEQGLAVWAQQTPAALSRL